MKFWHVADTTGRSRLIIDITSNVFPLAECLHTVDFKNGFAITLELVPLDQHKDGTLFLV